jgi:hypothetical protein
LQQHQRPHCQADHYNQAPITRRQLPRSEGDEHLLQNLFNDKMVRCEPMGDCIAKMVKLLRFKNQTELGRR